MLQILAAVETQDSKMTKKELRQKPKVSDMVKEKNIPKIQKLEMWESNRSLKNFNSNCLQLKIQKHQKMNWGKKLKVTI